MVMQAQSPTNWHDVSWRRNARRAAPPQSPVDRAAFTVRLNRLFDAVHPPGRGPFSNIEVIEQLDGRGHAISASYLSQLRTGQRKCPSTTTVGALAEFFGIRPHYFTNDDPRYCAMLDDELHWLRLAHDATVRQLTTELLHLPPDVREELLAALI